MPEQDTSKLNQLHISSKEQLIEGVYYCLPSEQAASDRELARIATSRFGLASDISDAMQQSSETWHDNAPVDVLFGHLKQLDKNEARIVNAARTRHLVDFPTPEIDFVTIGSRVTCEISGDRFELDIVGNMPVNGGSNDNVDQGSVDAPLPQALIGKHADETTKAEIAPDRVIAVWIISINQEAQQTEFDNSRRTETEL